MAVGPSNIGGADFLRQSPQARQPNEDNESPRVDTDSDVDDGSGGLDQPAGTAGAAEANPDNVVAPSAETSDTSPTNSGAGETDNQAAAANPATVGDIQTLGSLVDIEV